MADVGPNAADAIAELLMLLFVAAFSQPVNDGAHLERAQGRIVPIESGTRRIHHRAPASKRAMSSG